MGWTEVKSIDQQSATCPEGSVTWQRRRADSDGPEAASTSTRYTLHWHDRQTQHIRWHLAQRHTNTGQSSVGVTLIKRRNCSELQNAAMIELIKTLAWLQICKKKKLSSQYLCVHSCTAKNKTQWSDTPVSCQKQFNNNRETMGTGMVVTSNHVKPF